MMLATWTLLLSFPQDVKVGPELVVAEGATITRPRAASGDEAYLVVWTSGWSGVGATADILGRRLRHGTLDVLDPEPLRICAAPEAQDNAVVAYAAGRYLVIWQDLRNGTDLDIRGALVDAATGKVLKSDIEIAVRPRNQARPSVASSGGNFLVVWQEAEGLDAYGISGTRVSAQGEVLDTPPHAYVSPGANPVVAVSGPNALLTWEGMQRPGATLAALLDPVSGAKRKDLGIVNPSCANGTAIAVDNRGGFVTVSSREGFPNPWGWPGPGAVVCSRVMSDGTSPDAKPDLGYRMANLSTGTIASRVDAATWGASQGWPAGTPGGFPGTSDGLWPHGWPAVAVDGRGGALFVWVKGALSRDRLNLDNLDLWLGGKNIESLETTLPARRVAAEVDADETRPVLVGGPDGEVLLVYEKLKRNSPRRLTARLFRVDP